MFIQGGTFIPDSRVVEKNKNFRLAFLSVFYSQKKPT
jgi:hypothetical protein